MGKAGKWHAMEDSTDGCDDRRAFIDGLAKELGEDRRPIFEGLAIADLRYLSWRWDTWPLYAAPRRGAWLLTWESSSVERGETALAEIEACGLPVRSSAKALDVGCGEGGFLVAMARRGLCAHGVDTNEGNVVGSCLRARAWDVSATPTQGSATDLPYSDHAFELVTCGDVIEHVPNPHQALREMARVLRPGGTLWIATPPRFAMRHIWRDPHHHYFGLSVLPHKLAIWYLVRFRRALKSADQYGVETLLTYHGLMAALRSVGFEIVAGEYKPLVALRNPSIIETPWKRKTLRVLLRAGLRLPLNALFGLLAELRHPIRLVCRKNPR